MVFLKRLSSVGWVWMIPQTSFAHAPIDGLGNFYNGLLHPLLVLPHFLVIAALGLYLGVHGLRQHKVVFSTFIGANILGLILAYKYGNEGEEGLFLITAVVIGVAVCVNKCFPILVSLILSGGIGLYMGADSTLDGVIGQDLVIALIGCAIGAINLLLYASGLASYCRGSGGWKVILTRVLGSWIIACSTLVLAASVVTL